MSSRMRPSSITHDEWSRVGWTEPWRVWSSGTLEELAVADRGALRERSRDTRARSGARATAVDDVIRLRTPAGDVMTLRGHRDDVNSVAFSADGSCSSRRVATTTRGSGTSNGRADPSAGRPPRLCRRRPLQPRGRWASLRARSAPVSGTSAPASSSATSRALRHDRSPLPSDRTRRRSSGEEGEGVVRSYRCALCGTVADLRVIAERRLERAGQALSAEERARYLE